MVNTPGSKGRRRKVRILEGTPAELGYRFPTEWVPHQGTWLSWPRPESISFPDKYHAVPPVLARIVRAIAARERVHINVPNGNSERIVRRQLREHGCPTRNVVFHRIPTNECWCRDHGPAFVVRPSRGRGTRAAIVDWGFNAWGGKYPRASAWRCWCWPGSCCTTACTRTWRSAVSSWPARWHRTASVPC